MPPTNPLSKYIITQLAKRRGLAVRSVIGTTITVEPDGTGGDTKKAVATFTEEVNRGNPATVVTVVLVDSRK